MSKQHSFGSLTVLLACGLSTVPQAAFAQSFTAPPANHPSITSNTSNFVAPAQTQTQTQTQTQINNPVQQKLDQPLSLPSLFGNTTILPTDTLMGNFKMGELVEGKGKGHPRSYKIDNLSAFLHGQGWQGEIAADNRGEFDESNAIIEDTNILDSAALVPISYLEQFPAHFCSTSTSEQPVLIRVNESSKHLIIFTDNNQFLSGKISGSEDALLSGLPGTVLGSHNGILTLHKGRLVVDSGKQGVKLACKSAGMKLSADSCAMVDYRPGKSVAIRILSCPAGNKAKVRLAVQKDITYELGSGEEITVDLSQESASPESIVNTGKFSLDTYVSSLPKQVLGLASYKRLVHHVCQAAGVKELENKTVLEASEPVRMLATEGTRFYAAENGHISLLSGRVLLHNDAAQITRTQMGDLYMQKNSTLSLERWQGELRAQCCSGPKSIILVSDNFGVPMIWGMETLLVDHEPTWSDAFPNDGVGRRRFEMHSLKTNKCLISDFSLPALIVKGPHFKALHKDNTPETRDLRAELLKTAAALQVVTGYKGQYATQAPAAVSNATQTN